MADKYLPADATMGGVDLTDNENYPPSMTNDELNRKVAEVAGWTNIKDVADFKPYPKGPRHLQGTEPPGSFYTVPNSVVPDFLVPENLHLLIDLAERVFDGDIYFAIRRNSKHGKYGVWGGGGTFSARSDGSLSKALALAIVEGTA